VLQTINQGVGGVGNLLQIATFQIAATLFEMVSSPPRALSLILTLTLIPALPLPLPQP